MVSPTNHDVSFTLRRAHGDVVLYFIFILQNFHHFPLAFMGVRTYTLVMTSLPSLTNGHSPAGAGVVIDCSSMHESLGDLDRLIAWMSSCPRSNGMQVYLPSVAHRASMQRLQRSLQSIGCTVTLRVHSRSASALSSN